MDKDFPATPAAKAGRAAPGDPEDGALALIGQLAGGILHEISSPAASLSSNIETRQRLLESLEAAVRQEGAPGPTAPQTLEMLADLQAIDRLACDRITALLRAWKSTTRLTDDPLGPVVLDGILSDAVRLVRAEFRQRIHIETRFGALAAVWGAAAPLGRAFLNLLVNAAQAVEGDGQIIVETADRGSAVETRITDTGRGMTAEIQERIFRRGFTTKPVGAGTGLGLFLSRQIIEDQHRGTIRFESSPGQGTTFFVVLPAARSPQEEP